MSIFKIMSVILLSLALFMSSLLGYLILSSHFLAIDWELFVYQGDVFVYSVILDWVSVSFLLVVFLISGSVMWYSHEYMSHEASKVSFAWVVLLFVVSMMFLIISPSLVSVILGWDGLGLVSYLLVVYYQNYKSYAAGMITCLSNRVGDSAILIAMGWMLSLGSLDFLYFVGEKNSVIMVVSGFIILAAMTKSAQIPFSAWLPAAMAAPTPVSALVHSSTLVTAGVFLLIRFYPCIMFTEVKSLLFIAGGLTMTMASLGALYETDLKKIIALSTLSQLGLMMMALSMNLYILAFFHLLTHALFKASLFLAAGSIIHLYNGSQDVRHLSVVSSCMPLTSSLLVICSLALGGMPFMSAFYSKDKIIEVAFSGSENFFCLTLLFVSVLLTMMYSFRLIYMANMESYVWVAENNKDSFNMVIPMGILSFGGITGGSAISWAVLDLFYDNLFMFFKVSILYMFVVGLVLGLLVILKLSSLSYYLSSMWFLPSLSAKMMSSIGLKLGSGLLSVWDMGWNEVMGPAGLGRELNSMSAQTKIFSSLSYKSVLFLSLSLILVSTVYLIY